ncbi:Cytochrome c oxidase polypeptide I [Candidatus Nasuia deltocephalinicola]|nr:Cytochrome c oxidase polypeptide I [Candidatus Nasuia deltocephalinicola]
MINKIGFFYLLNSFFMFLFGGGLILFARIELLNTGLNIMIPEYFNSIITLHGFVMIFGVIMSAFFGLSYIIIPYLIFPKKFIFNKISNISFFLLIIPLIILCFINFTKLGGISTGWTIYAPLSIQYGLNMDLTIICIIFIAISSILNSINISITILNNIYNNISVYFISQLISSYLIIISFPALIGVLIMLLLDRNINTSFFNPILKGDCIMYQHIFWFFGHPEVYIIILPSFGIISQLLSVFTKNKIFDYKNMFYSILSIGFFSLVAWGHHMYVTGMPIWGQIFFMYCTILISIPTSIKLFNWLFTILNGFILLETPFLFCIGFILFFLIGGISGLILSIIPLNIYYHGTYFVIAHFHYILVASSIFSIFSCWYYWSPLIFKIKYDDLKSKIHFWLSFFFINLIFFPMHFLGFKGMPRRYIDYPFKYIYYNKFISISTVFFFLIQLFYLYFILFPFLKKI